MSVCCMCHEDKPEEAFAFRSLATGERQTHCRQCHAAYRRQHYLDNRALYIAREVARIEGYRLQNRILLFEYLSHHPCVDCDESDVRILEFDHRDPSTKLENIGHLAARKPWKFVLAEIEKCDVRCVNCHRRRTAMQCNWSKLHPAAVPNVKDVSPPLEFELMASNDLCRCVRCGEVKPANEFSIKNRKTGRRGTICRSCVSAYGREHYRRNKSIYLARAKKNRAQFRGRNRSRVLAYLEDKCCVDCGETDALVLEFDHRDGREKEDDVSRLIMGRQWDKVEAEIAKCDIRCGNCHRRRTAEQLGWMRHALYLAVLGQDGSTSPRVGADGVAA